jgi:hypothetical protein
MYRTTKLTRRQLLEAPEIGVLKDAREAHAASPTWETAAAVEAAFKAASRKIYNAAWGATRDEYSRDVREYWAESGYDPDLCGACGAPNKSLRAHGPKVVENSHRDGTGCYTCGSGY